ncbi:hypothetical protein SBOR_5854 [Sclerotinia borealis F-4128]|uniref:Uncharacterized protein n=1 Tax=Sclerotinia borealis (strain F-4128) TaxID=1432307 RepID=W9CD18_SCLBF|nr:hypothetical protein SBOR_5854 [Sclerotinia borealis F-4128]
MCNLIFTLCPTCSKVAASPRVKKCAERFGPFMNVTPCITTETKIIAKNPCVSCPARRQEPSGPTRLLTRDIIEEMSFKIPECYPTPQSKDPILPEWTSETLAPTQNNELFFEHITKQHSVEVKNRQDLSSQRGGIPLCLVAGVGRNQTPARLYRRPPRFTPGGRSRPKDRATIALPPSAWNNRRRISRLGIPPAPRASSLQATPTRTPSCLVPEGIKRRSQVQHKLLMVSPLTPIKPPKLHIPLEASASTQPQDTGSAPSSATSSHSKYLLPGPSPQVETFSAVSFAQIPAHYDMRPVSIPPPLRVPTPQQRVEERERRGALQEIQQRIKERQERERQDCERQERERQEQDRERQDRERQERERQEQERQVRERQQLETQRIRDFQEHDFQEYDFQPHEDHRSRSEVAPPRTVNDVQFQSVRPLRPSRSLKMLSRIRSFSPLQGFDD